MGLMQLLAIGSSLGKVGERANRYKMAQQTLLPKFGLSDRPETRTAGAAAALNPRPNRTVSRDPDGVGAHRKSAPTEKKTMKTIEAELSPGAAAHAPKQAFPLGRWTIFKNPFSRTPKEAASAATPTGQLMLDLVKPVRNDLNDSDLELVPAAPPAPAAKALPMPSSELVWTQIKTQLFGAGKV